MSINPTIEDSWKMALDEEFGKPYFSEIKARLLEEKSNGQIIFPPGPKIFSAFNKTPFPSVKAVILGQDPYHGPNQANGLCFSVSDGIKPPPSLVNIYKELQSDKNIDIPNHGNLEKWASQGVFLLNAVLTVRAHQPASHKDFGWMQFTDAVISKLSQQREHVVFILWGKFAQSKKELIDNNKHHIIESTHPSPFSAHRGFLGSQPFSKCNHYLISKGIEPIDWSL